MQAVPFPTVAAHPPLVSVIALHVPAPVATVPAFDVLAAALTPTSSSAVMTLARLVTQDAVDLVLAQLVAADASVLTRQVVEVVVVVAAAAAALARM